MGYQSLGELSVKNIEQPVRAYRVLTDPDQAGTLIEQSHSGLFTFNRLALFASVILIAVITLSALWWSRQPNPETKISPSVELTEKLSIAVLPFDNMSGDPEQEYFSDGMTEDLITDLSQISDLFVIARNSVFTYKGRAVNIQQVGRELGVNYVLEGSIRKQGDRVRINAQLIDTQTGGHLWAKRYDRNLTDVFALQDEVVAKIVEALTITLKPDEKERLYASVQVNPKAYDALLRGLEKFRRFSDVTNREAREFFEEAIALDPNFARAHADLALTYFVETEQHWNDDPKKSISKALEIGEHALSLDNTIAQVYFVLASVYRNMKRIDDAITAANRAIELDPNYADGYTVSAINFNYAGRAEEGLIAIRQATRLNPSKPFFYVWTEGQSNYVLGNFEEAARLFEQVLESNPEFTLAHKMLAATYMELGKTEDAKWAVDELLTYAPDFTLAVELERTAYTGKEFLSRYIDNLRKAGLE